MMIKNVVVSVFKKKDKRINYDYVSLQNFM